MEENSTLTQYKICGICSRVSCLEYSFCPKCGTSLENAATVEMNPYWLSDTRKEEGE